MPPEWMTPPAILAELWKSRGAPEGAEIHEYFDQHSDDASDLSWIDHFADLVLACEWQSKVSEVRSFLSDRAWRDRRRRGLLVWRDEFMNLSTLDDANRYRIYYLGANLRYDFRLATMAKATTEWLRRSRLNHEHDGDDALLLALHAFAILEREPDEGLAFIESAMTSLNASVSSRNTCLHALWLVKSIPNQGDLMLDIVREKKRAGDVLGAVEHFWIAKAHRLRGDFQAAFTSIDTAFDKLTPNVDFLSIHQDFVRERENISAAAQMFSSMEQHLASVSKRLTETGDELHQHVSSDLHDAKTELLSETKRAEERIAESLLNIVTIIGVFVAIIGLLAAGGAVMFNKKFSFGQDIVLLALTGILAIMFLWVLRTIVAGSGPSRNSWRKLIRK